MIELSRNYVDTRWLQPVSKTVDAEAVTAFSSGSLLVHPRQAVALWGEAGDRRLQWHLRQISI